ncbi:MAG: GTPase Era [Clostridia bacterium]|nr:GTPase Era [Clostridia bacterium]MBQ9408166.1 GTPase Era [Clostridia bacterium]
MQNNSNEQLKSGFVAILGRPNVGKSSIMNRLVGEKVAIVSPKAQTTRMKALGVCHRDNTQIVFVDTPGIHHPRTRLGEFMVKAAEDAKDGVDAIMVVVDAGFIGPGDKKIIDDIRTEKCPKILVVNKTDSVTPEQLMPRLGELDVSGFDEVISVSALKGTNMDRLFELLKRLLPYGPEYFPEDMITDQPERVMIAEIIREKALRNLRDEIPHGVGVEMLSIQKVSDHLTEIHANVYCEKASHKSVIIGKQGAMLGKIGSEARADIERLLGTKVMLKLWVKVREDWRNRKEDLRNLGYTEEE